MPTRFVVDAPPVAVARTYRLTFHVPSYQPSLLLFFFTLYIAEMESAREFGKG